MSDWLHRDIKRKYYKSTERKRKNKKKKKK